MLLTVVVDGVVVGGVVFVVTLASENVRKCDRKINICISLHRTSELVNMLRIT